MFKSLKPVDKKAPRFRKSKYRYKVLNRDFHSRYVRIFNSNIDYDTFKSIIQDFNTEITNEVIENRDGVKLPAMMGVMALCSFKPKTNPPLDWKSVTEYNLKIKDLNLRTNELACKIVYSVYGSKYRFKHFHLWRFEGCRTFKTRVSEAFRNNFNKYKRMDNKSRISKMFRDDYITTDFKLKIDEQRVDS